MVLGADKVAAAAHVDMESTTVIGWFHFLRPKIPLRPAADSSLRLRV